MRTPAERGCHTETVTTTIRPATLEDLPRLKHIAVVTNMFTPQDVGFLDEMVAGSLDGSLVDHHWLVVETDAGVVVAGVCYAPEPFADRMWNLYFISVDPSHQQYGTGGRLLQFVEDALRARGDHEARVLIIETSSTHQYARTRNFYRHHGFDEEARIRQFYGPDDHKIVFWKSLDSEPLKPTTTTDPVSH